MKLRIPATWLRMSRISKKLRHLVVDYGRGPRLRNYTERGSYPLFYRSVWAPYHTHKECRDLCPYCASYETHEAERVIEAHINWENGSLECEACNTPIERAYP